MINLSDLPDFPSEGKFIYLYIFSRGILYTGSVAVKYNLTLQRNRVFIKAVWCLVLTWWTFCGLQWTSSESQYFIFDVVDVVAFNGVVLWRVQLAGLSVVDITVDCCMILLFLCRIWCREISSHVNIRILCYFCAVC